VRFLFADAASYIAGQVIPGNGARRCDARLRRSSALAKAV
jgi:hypothetical protein